MTADLSSRSELGDSHNAQLAGLRATHADTVEAHRQRINEANDGLAKGLTATAAAHMVEHDARFLAFQTYAASVFDPIVAAVVPDPSRANLIALIAAYNQVNDESERVLGKPSEIELAYAIADHHAQANPDAIKRFVALESWHAGEMTGSAVTNDVGRLNVMLKRKTDIAGVQMALLKLESAIATMGASTRVADATFGDVDAFWQLVRFGGHPMLREEKLKAHRKAAFDAVHPPEKLAQDFANVQKRFLPNLLTVHAEDLIKAAKEVVADGPVKALSRKLNSAPQAVAADHLVGDAEMAADVAQFHSSIGDLRV